MADILKRIIDGNPQSTRDFYLQFSQKILSYLKKRLPHEEDAQEIMQDVFLDAIDSLYYLQRQTSVQSWLYSIAHNKVVDYYRKRKIKSIVLSAIPVLQIAAEEIHQPEFQFEKDKIRDKIEKAFASISTRYQEILIMRYENNIPIKQLAVDLHLSFKATESLLFRARQDFKKAYERA